ncbi:hypothetical protein SAMN04488010_1259 [Maribacter stanieri]|uniref:TonB-dependent Receptor Plug Domain n=2 Tax=Maribacter stanieri TaxID=440514 RepID=A0A1I6I7M4_9FLAO|nr:hypothetical protein SAMN04488010_1259 [Maribacter stanieri]
MQRIPFLFLLLFTNVLMAQTDIGNNLVKDKFLKYFELPRETVFLHTNKSTYITNEEIWFKGYVYDRHNSKPFQQSSAIHLGLYNHEGNQLKTYHFRAKDGFFKGNIEVDSVFASGTYYLRASTNWMKNFKEDDSYLQKIVILNEEPLKKPVAATGYDIQFLPEGGNFIVDAPNVMGVKVTDSNGYGVRIVEGSIFDMNNAQVARFSTSIFGLGKFNFNPKAGMAYVAKLKFSDGSMQTVEIQKAENKGVSFSVKNVDKDRLIISLTTNNATKESIQEEPFYLLIHRDGHANRIPVTFPKNKLFVSKILNKDILSKGMNILTLFDANGKPIAERLVFNYADLLDGKLNVNKLVVEGDSIKIQLKLQEPFNDLHNLSVSVLPGKTMSYNQQNSIYSAFYLKPYVRGFIENPSYYFKNVTAKKENNLDLLLMTQGWSKYDWNDIFKGPPNQFYEFENGIDLEGTINSRDISSTNKLLVSFPDDRSTYLDILDNRFLIQKYFPVKGEVLNFALISDNKKLTQPNIDLNIRLGVIPTRINTVRKEKVERIVADTAKEVAVPDLVYADNTISLNEVTVVDNKIKKTVENNVFIPKYLKGKMTEVTEDIEFNFPLISDIIRSRGYYVREELSFGSTDRVIIRTRTVQSFDSKRSMPVPVIYLDNVRLTTFDLLYRMPTNEVESFLIDKTGAGEGVRGSAGVIRIYTRRRPRDYDAQFGKDVNVLNYKLKEGFEPVKKFYTPKYNSYLSDEFENFGTIHWAPELKMNENGIATFKILNTLQRDIIFYIEGMNANGNLISSEQSLIIE